MHLSRRHSWRPVTFHRPCQHSEKLGGNFRGILSVERRTCLDATEVSSKTRRSSRLLPASSPFPPRFLLPQAFIVYDVGSADTTMEAFDHHRGGTCWFPFKKAYNKRRHREDSEYNDRPEVYFIQKTGPNGRHTQCEVALYEYDGETTSQFKGETELILEGHPTPSRNNKRPTTIDTSKSRRTTADVGKEIIQPQKGPSRKGRMPINASREDIDMIEPLPRALAAIETNPMTKRFWTEEALCSDQTCRTMEPETRRWRCGGDEEPPLLRVNSLTRSEYESMGLLSESQKAVWRSRVNSITPDGKSRAALDEGNESWFDDAVSTQMVIVREVRDGDEESNSSMVDEYYEEDADFKSDDDDELDSAVDEIRRQLAEAGRDASKLKRAAYEEKTNPSSDVTGTGNFFDYLRSASLGMYSEGSVQNNDLSHKDLNEAVTARPSSLEGREEGKHSVEEQNKISTEGDVHSPENSDDDSHPNLQLTRSFSPLGFRSTPSKKVITGRHVSAGAAIITGQHVNSHAAPTQGEAQPVFSIEVEALPDHEAEEPDHEDDARGREHAQQHYSAAKINGPRTTAFLDSEANKNYLDRQLGASMGLQKWHKAVKASQRAFLDDEEKEEGVIFENAYDLYKRTLQSDPGSPSSATSRHLVRKVANFSFGRAASGKAIKNVRSFGSPFSGSHRLRSESFHDEHNESATQVFFELDRVNHNQDFGYSESVMPTLHSYEESPHGATFGAALKFTPNRSRADIPLERTQSGGGYLGRLRSGIESMPSRAPKATRQEKIPLAVDVNCPKPNPGKLSIRERSNSCSSASSSEQHAMVSRSKHVVTPTLPWESSLYDDDQSSMGFPVAASGSSSGEDDNTDSPPSVILSPARQREKSTKTSWSTPSRNAEATRLYSNAIRKQDFADDEDSIFSDLDGSKDDDDRSSNTAGSKSTLDLSRLSAGDMTAFTDVYMEQQDGPFACMDRFLE
jgi:hypothetical protein